MKTNLKHTLFGSTDCTHCHTLKVWLEDKGVSMEYKDIYEHVEEATEYNNRTVPYIIVQDEEGELVKKLGNSEECKEYVEEMLL